MLTGLLLFLTWTTAPQPTPAEDEGPPTLIVEVVDPVYIPLPNSEVSVKATNGRSSKSARTDDNGYAKFWMETGIEYSIEAKTDGFDKKILKHVFIPSSPTPLQIKLRPKGPFNYQK